jgi:hypothetical protein
MLVADTETSKRYTAEHIVWKLAHGGVLFILSLAALVISRSSPI